MTPDDMRVLMKYEDEVISSIEVFIFLNHVEKLG